MHTDAATAPIAYRPALVRRLSLALLLALPGPLAADCTPAPPRPAGAAVSDAEWKAAVLPNCFDNRLRLGRWTGQATRIAAKQSPARFFSPLGPASIIGGSVAVLVHGWAPGFRPAVDKAGGNLQWWSDGAVDSTGVWASDWAWVPFSGTDRNQTPVTRTGVFQERFIYDVSTVILGYSWIDDSATLLKHDTQLDLVYRSEAYTNVNGLRLAAALEQVFDPSFWTRPGSRLHLIGHSHGSKVATVAALALQSRGRRVDQLTVLDSPESLTTLRANASNLLGHYLNQLTTSSGTGPSGTATFVDNYISEFGAAFAGSANAGRVVEVVLNPLVLSCADLGNRHSYAAAWYGGAAAAAASSKLPPIGFAWPPPQTPNQPALNQQWPGGNQWTLTAGAAGSLGCGFTAPVWTYSARSTSITREGSTGNVSGSPATGLVFTADTGSGVINSSYSGATDFYTWTQFGIAFDVEWTAPAAGDYLVITGSEPVVGTQEVLLVMDGRSAIAGRNPVSINAEVGSWLDFDVYYLPARNNHAGKVTLSDFRRVEVGSASTPNPADTAPRGRSPLG